MTASEIRVCRVSSSQTRAVWPQRSCTRHRGPGNARRLAEGALCATVQSTDLSAAGGRQHTPHSGYCPLRRLPATRRTLQFKRFSCGLPQPPSVSDILLRAQSFRKNSAAACQTSPSGRPTVKIVDPLVCRPFSALWASATRSSRPGLIDVNPDRAAGDKTEQVRGGLLQPGPVTGVMIHARPDQPE